MSQHNVNSETESDELKFIAHEATCLILNKGMDRISAIEKAKDFKLQQDMGIQSGKIIGEGTEEDPLIFLDDDLQPQDMPENEKQYYKVYSEILNKLRE